MQVKIEDHFLGEVAKNKKVFGKAKYPEGVLKSYKRSLFRIRNTQDMTDLNMIRGFHFKKIETGKFKGKHAIRLNDGYRLIFRIENLTSSKIKIICIEAISNHYT